MKKLIFIAILALFGIMNAFYLSFKAYELNWGALSQPSFSSICDMNDTFSCTNVLTHPYSKIFGIPFPMIALVVYPVLCLLALYGYWRKSYKTAQILAILSGLGMCFNGYVITIETFYIHAYCPLCLICTAIIITIFILSLRIITREKNNS